jgi:8-oxo-dGTP pyrophosphatase MutT (NUDIX family)
MSKAHKKARLEDAVGFPPVLFAAVTGKELARALRRGALRRKKGRALRLYATREEATGSPPCGILVRVDAVEAFAGGVRIVPKANGYSTRKVPLRFLSCSRMPNSTGDVRFVEAAGGVVVKEGPEPRVLVLLKREGESDSWVLPKGRRRPDEDEVETAIREVSEETGLDQFAVGRFLARERYFDTANGSSQFKNVAYYLMHCPDVEARPRIRRKEGFADAKWMTLAEALEATKPLRAHRALKRAIDVLAKEIGCRTREKRGRPRVRTQR